MKILIVDDSADSRLILRKTLEAVMTAPDGSEALKLAREVPQRLYSSGCPDWIKGNEIGLYADIIHVADSFDSMTADRPYRHSMGKEYAVSELKRLAGEHFNPVLVNAFLRALGKKPGTVSPD